MSDGRHLKRVAVFCGANTGSRPEYLQSARDVGAELVKRNIGLVYGGMFPGTLPLGPACPGSECVLLQAEVLV